jgi:hypothetical protein
MSMALHGALIQVQYVEESVHVDEPEDDGLPLAAWKLTTGERTKPQEEMEAIVLKEPIEKVWRATAILGWKQIAKNF